MTLRPLFLLPVALAVLFAGCGGSGGGGDAVASPGLDGSPEAAIEQVLELIDRQQWGAEWDNLHPEQQKLVSRERFINCSDASDSPGVDFNRVLSINDEDSLIPGTATRAPMKAVTVEYEITRGPRRNKSADTFYLFDVDGRWRWVLSNAKVEAYKAGGCPG